MFLEKMTKSRKRVFSLLDVCIMSQKCQENKVASKTREKNFVFEKKDFFSDISGNKVESPSPARSRS